MNKKVLFIKNCQLVLETGITWDAALVAEDGIITAIGKEKNMTAPEGATVVDAGGKYVGPGFVDLHVHGAIGKNINFETEAVARYFLKHGTTSILASPWYRLDFDTFISAIKIVKEAMPKAPTVKGFYMEGPFTNPKFGSSARDNPWKHGIIESEYRALVDEAGEYAKVWTIGPELEGIADFTKYAREVNPDVVFAVGHSEATPEQIRALGRYRPTLGTHVTNATGRIGHLQGIVGVGPDEYCYYEPDVYCELISDSQCIHVKPDIQRLLLHTKTVNKIVLITDGSIAREGAVIPEKYIGVTDINFSPYGEVAGSNLTMNAACKNIMTHTSVGITEAFLMASRNPARVIGLDHEIGTIECGKRADLVIVDDKFNVDTVILGGEVCVFEEE